MVMTSIEIIAAIFAILIIVKLLFVIFKPARWMKITDPLLRNGTVTAIIYLILTVIVGYYIFSVFNIVQVAAIMMFTSLLIGAGLLMFAKPLLKLRKEATKQRYKAWLSIIIWLAIAVWTLIALFA